MSFISQHNGASIDLALSAVMAVSTGLNPSSSTSVLADLDTFPIWSSGVPKHIAWSNLRLEIADSITPTTLGLVIGTHVQAYDATYLVDADIGVSVQAYDADLTTWAGLTPSANAQSLVTAANYAAMRTLLDVESGVDFDPVGTDNSDNNAANTSYANDYRAANFVSGTDYEPAKGGDDNFVTDAEKVVIGNTSGTNTGDQTLPTSGVDFDPVGTDNSDNNAANTTYASDYRAANFVSGTDYAPALGADDNYVTDAEKVVIGNTSGTNSGDQAIPASGVDFDPVGTDNSTGVTLAGTPDYITLVGQVLTRNAVDLSTDVTGALATGTVPWGQLTSVPSTFAPSAHNHATSEITSGTFADARIAASNVTQHQASITIASSKISDKGSASGVASLDGTGKIPSSQLPALAITSVYTAVSEIAQLALTTQEGDVVVRTDENKSYIHNGGVAGTMADWQLLNTPTDTVLSVNGYTGSVTLSKSDVGLGSVENTALSTWAGTSSITTVGTVGTGTWQGTPVGAAYGGTGLESISTLLNSSVTPDTLGLVIGADVQAYDATYLVDADIGVNVQAYDATYLVDADIGVNIQAYDATYLVDADIGVNVQAYDAGLQALADLADGSGVLTNNGTGGFSWASAGGNGDALVANPLSQFAATTSAQLLGVISDETGSGSLVFATAPTFASIADTGVVSAGTWQGGVIDVAYGGTGLASISTLLNSNVTATSLGLVIGTNTQAWDADLDAIAALAKTDSNFIVGNGTAWVAESGATARTSLGVDAAGTDNSTNVSLAGTPDYLTLVGQVLTRNAVDLSTDVTGALATGTVPWSQLTSVPSTFAPDAHTVDSHSNVTITTIASGELLKWSGTAWINNTLAEAGISATGHAHTASDVSDFDTEVGNNSAVTANTAKVTNANHTGEVTGSGALTIANNAVTLSKMATIATASLLGRNTAGVGDPEVLSASDARTLLNVADGAEVNPAVISQADAEAGTSTAENIFTAQRVAQAIAALGSSGGGSYNPVEARMLQRRVSSSAAASAEAAAAEAAAPEVHSLVVHLASYNNLATVLGSPGYSATSQLPFTNGQYVMSQFRVPDDLAEFTEAYVTVFTTSAGAKTYSLESSGGSDGTLYNSSYATETGRSFTAVSGNYLINNVDIADYLNAHATAGSFMSLVIKATSGSQSIGTHLTLKWQ